jgi:hypothetical protein
MPDTGVCTFGGNLNASDESIYREKKFPTSAAKLVQIATIIGQFSTLSDIVEQSF